MSNSSYWNRNRSKIDNNYNSDKKNINIENNQRFYFEILLIEKKFSDHNNFLYNRGVKIIFKKLVFLTNEKIAANIGKFLFITCN